ncbi:hypothetical protein PV721_05880 [Streptomyces sp. MB09-01]|uniref:hypothetical protein n=1 Tax=Streptomyces sp. MB09-01 TaxID=3028666 RepID=UPI0029A4CF65|nr:hypothetical protein [Streptomyces sp. MB09-01]MDX3533901.1 hypothetical protein [Streptomyces sp. MB09-01]
MEAIVLLRGPVRSAHRTESRRQVTGADARGSRRGVPHHGRAMKAVVTISVAAVLCGCGATAPRLEGARQAGEAFEQALADADYARACGLLAPQTRQQLEENEEKPCGPALPGQELPVAGQVRGTQVHGRQALLRLQKDTLFLSQFDDGWKVVAADCAPQGEQPYRCSLKGG